MSNSKGTKGTNIVNHLYVTVSEFKMNPVLVLTVRSLDTSRVVEEM